MRKRFVLSAVLVCASACFGQTDDKQPLPKFGLALTAGSLGVGVEGATAVARHTNIRFGFNYFSLGLSGTDSKDNLTYDATLRLASAEALVDEQIAGPVHISAGALVYDGFRGTGNIHVPGGQTLTLNHVMYFSSMTDPVTGTAQIGARKIAPEVLIGFGNLLPRSARHFSANVDLGVAFQGSPNAKLNLTGSTCLTASTGCLPISASPAVQANVVAEQSTINSDLKPFQFYPVIRVSFGYKF